MMKPIVVEMTHQRSTPNQHLYVSESGAAQNIYLKKSDLGMNPPAKIKITIEEA